MALNTVLVLAAGFGILGAGQDPSLDQQIVTPVLGASQNSQGSAPATSSQKVTVQFRGVKASEVLSWLENRGVNFVVSEGEIPSNATITLNLQDASLDGAVDAIARALGGHWEKENGIRVFKRGESPFRFFSGPEISALPRGEAGKSLLQNLPRNNTFRKGQGFGTMPALPKMPLMPGMPAMPAMPDMPQGRVLTDKEAEKYFGKDYQKRMEQWSKEFSKKFGPEQQKAWEKWAQDFSKQQKDFGPEFQQKFQKDFGPEYQLKMQKEFGPEFQRKMEKMDQEMQKQFGPEFQRKMEKMGQEMEKRFGPGSDFERKMKQMAEEGAKEGRVYRLNKEGDFYKLDKKQAEEIRKEVARARQEGVRARQEGLRAREEGARARIEAQRARTEALREFQGRAWVAPRSGQGGGFTFVRPRKGDVHFFRTDSGSSLDIKKFLKNLSPDQRDRQRKRGYIWWDDLTREQKEMLGGRPDGRFEIRYKINDDEITIRGN